MSIKEYRLTSMEEPTDAMLHELMYQVACSARQSSNNAKQVLKQKMQGKSAWEYLGKFFTKIFNGCKDFISLRPDKFSCKRELSQTCLSYAECSRKS